MILTYHEVTASASSYGYSVSPEQLEQHLRYLDERAGAAPEITFDDGHASNYKYALPLLEKVGRKAIFFITVGWTGERPEYMDWPKVRELARLGHQVQAHGWSHKFLTECSSEELTVELGRAKAEIENKLGQPVDAVAAPGGRWDGRVARACASAGYARLYTSDPWRKDGQRGQVRLLGRFMVKRTMGCADIERLLDMKPGTAALYRAKGTAQWMVRRAIGEAGYQRLWNHLYRRSQRIEIDDEYRRE